MYIFSFPSTRFVSENNIFNQLKHVRSETNEAMDAHGDGEGCLRIAEELLDVIGSAETGLRILAERHGVNIDVLHADVKCKNSDRGYYS